MCASYILGTILGTSQIVISLNLHNNPKKKHYYYLHFTYEQTEVKHSWRTENKEGLVSDEPSEEGILLYV